MEMVHSRDRNDKLLEFLTRRSVADFQKFTAVLSKYQRCGLMSNYFDQLLVFDALFSTTLTLVSIVPTSFTLDALV